MSHGNSDPTHCPDCALGDFARNHYMRELQRAGANVLLYTHGMLHSKAMIVDEVG